MLDLIEPIPSDHVKSGRPGYEHHGFYLGIHIGDGYVDFGFGKVRVKCHHIPIGEGVIINYTGPSGSKNLVRVQYSSFKQFRNGGDLWVVKYLLGSLSPMESMNLA